MELLDVINEKGKVLFTKDRKSIYLDGNLHRTVHIWIINSKKELLVQKRGANKDTYPNLWAISTAGHVKAGDNSIETALRELKEEVGVKAREEELEFLFQIRRKEIQGENKINTLDDVYLIERDLDIEKTKLQFSELTDIKYVYYEYLEQIFKNNDEDYVPRCEEHDLLFKFLHDRFDEHDSMKVLYKTECEYNYTDHVKFCNLYYKHSLLYKVILISFMLCIIFNGVIYFERNEILPLITVLLISFIYIINIIYLGHRKIKDSFESNKLLKNSNIIFTFYEDYFSVKTKQINIKVYYGQLYSVAETDDNYYLYSNIDNAYIITKNNIDSSFNSFLKNKATCPYKKYGKR